MVAHFAPVLVLTPKEWCFGINMTTCCPQRGGFSVNIQCRCFVQEGKHQNRHVLYNNILHIYYMYTTWILPRHAVP